MGKKLRKLKFKINDTNVFEAIKKADDFTLLQIGNLVCSTDFGVRFYKNKKHKKFYKNRDELEKCIRRAYSMRAFLHSEQIIDMLYSENYLEIDKEEYDKLDMILRGDWYEELRQMQLTPVERSVEKIYHEIENERRIDTLLEKNLQENIE